MLSKNFKSYLRKFLWITLITLFLASSLLFLKTVTDLAPPPDSLSFDDSVVRKVQVLDRHKTPLTITYQNDWNIHDYVPLHEIPITLQQIFIIAEDKRFFDHNGPDWQARWHAMFQNIMALRVVRGASTMSEQTVRMLHPRPRTFWSRWLEGFEATRLEEHFSKAEILEFYLNQVPYAKQLRGVVQAARHYFDRDLDTLNIKEMMALSVLVRAPSRLDLRQGSTKIEAPIARLTKRLLELGIINEADYQNLLTTRLYLHDSNLPLQATHFVNYIYTSQSIKLTQTLGRLHTTLDAGIQRPVQKILDQRMQDLRSKKVNNGAVLVVEHHTNEVLAWANAGKPSPEIPGSQIDAVTTPRQPGSTLKPFLYALALEKGWTAATLIEDTPLAEAVGTGMHSYRNYSRSYYGSLRLRDVLGNSLNIPAVRTIQFVGASTFLQRLRQLGIESLTAHPDHYGDGLALGNGGVTLLELVQAYATLANKGTFRPLKVLRNTPSSDSAKIFTPEVSSIIGDILSDSDARRLEFGRSALLRFPIQTAIKTGTSNDYRDAWAIGFNHRYTVGVWLGNLDQQPMSRVSGSSGPALILRAVFAELNRYEETQPLYLSPQLIKVEICRATGQRATQDCPSRVEWFVSGTEPVSEEPMIAATQYTASPLRLRQPSHGLQLAMDPRIPDEHEAFALMLSDTPLKANAIEWLIDGKVIGTTPPDIHQFLWPVTRGTHIAQARILPIDSSEPLTTPTVKFYVK
ncbi:transglycosylase domain-containing protein [Candidatus Parabeggiatoa sp. HSG14]|uniref:transglycosylase domain-containing protein n=1 Tax=Candidatus Parabeggiatoa sp. HSG14 TaxID=3055593 RepID=UPI0025A7BB28|nr:transglycosylase domain-containing protein [Thiotrichales bacterium HSG14]